MFKNPESGSGGSTYNPGADMWQFLDYQDGDFGGLNKEVLESPEYQELREDREGYEQMMREIDAAVSSGEMTQEKANKIKAEIHEEYSSSVIDPQRKAYQSRVLREYRQKKEAEEAMKKQGEPSGEEKHSVGKEVERPPVTASPVSAEQSPSESEFSKIKDSLDNLARKGAMDEDVANKMKIILQEQEDKQRNIKEWADSGRIDEARKQELEQEVATETSTLLDQYDTHGQSDAEIYDTIPPQSPAQNAEAKTDNIINFAEEAKKRNYHILGDQESLTAAPTSAGKIIDEALQKLDSLSEKGEETDTLLASVKEMLNNESSTTETTEFPHTEESRATADRARRNGLCKKAFSRRARAAIAAVITTLTIALGAFGISAQATSTSGDPTHEPTTYKPSGESQTQVVEGAPSASLGSGSTVILKGPQEIIGSTTQTTEELDDSGSEVGSKEESASTTEATPIKGEMPNGTTYDYSEYVDYNNKISHWAFGHDKSQLAMNEDDQGTRAEILNMAKTPEVLAVYSYYTFNDAEKAELGISNMNPAEIDNLISTGENGGEIQQKLLNKLKDVINSGDTTLRFYQENNTEYSYYIYYEDVNGDGRMTPDEMGLRSSSRERNGAWQVDVYRSDGNGGTYKVLDLNAQCGLQPNFYNIDAMPGVPYVAPAVEKTAPIPAVDTRVPSSTVTPGTPAPSVVVTPETSTPTDDETPAPESTPTSTPETQDEETPSDEEAPNDESTPDKDKTSENNPTPTPSPEPVPEPHQLKDAENLTRVADGTFENNATNNGTETVTTTPTEEVSVENITPIPSGAETYNGTSYTDNIVQSESASGSSSTGDQVMTAEVVAPPSTPANDISQNRGGTSSESGYTPVQNDSSAQAQAETRQDTSASSAASAMGEFNAPASQAPQGESQE
ncbi:hypothetical protein IJG04_02475 [Candidatus Saccharibacteria bacterium]|nr:hypothetical protein [Candidatus Saccharibacteria bacterium]